MSVTVALVDSVPVRVGVGVCVALSVAVAVAVGDRVPGKPQRGNDVWAERHTNWATLWKQIQHLYGEA